MDTTLESWAKNLVGRDWEIYWSDESHCSENKKRNNEDHQDDTENMVVESLPETKSEHAEGAAPFEGDGEEEEDEEDWYDGHIEEIESTSDDGNYSFRVRFVGDETIYTMVLDPTIVRPSARAWIKRSKALLASHKSLAEWEKSLPPDTSTIDDQEQLAQLESQHDEYTGAGPYTASSSADGKPQNIPGTTELNQIQRLARRLSTQLYLRSKLAPIVEHAGGPSEAYVDHLLHCLLHCLKASQWYVKCWRLHQKVFFDPSSPPEETGPFSDSLNEDYAIKKGLQEGRRVITNLLRVDTSLAGSKRRRPVENSPGGTRKTKRRRRNKSLLDFIKESERGSETPKPEEDEFLSSDAVMNFVDQVQCNDNRWYTQNFVQMMQSISLHIVSPMETWRHKVEMMLGDRPESEGDGEQTDGETSEEESDEEGNETTGSNQSEQRFYTYDEIKSFEQSGNHDGVLRHFNLSRLQDRLGLKLSDIENFEKSCWSSVSQVFCTPVAEVLLKQNDNVYSELERLLVSASAATSSMNNVSPLGSSSSVLCRKVLDDALTLRGWYLDLHRVESSRERLVFIDKMVRVASELPRLPNCEYSTSLDGLFDQAVTRLRKISQGYFDHLTRFNKYRSILLARSDLSNDEGVDFTTVEGVSSALLTLGEIQVLSISEEMLSVRLDVLRWKGDAENRLAKPKISYDELVALKNNLDQIQKGCSPARSQILVSIESNDKVNAEIRSFAEADVTAFCGALVSLVNSKYAISCTWKERADAIVCAIKQHSGQQSSVQKPLPMVDLKRVSGLMRDYESSGIFLPEDLSFLHNVYETATKWSNELTAFLLDEAMPFADLLSRLQSSKVDRPRGIIVEPTRHVIDTLADLLAWHQQAIEAMNEVRGNLVEANVNNGDAVCTPSTLRCVYTLVAEGSEVLEEFGSKPGARDFAVPGLQTLNLMFKELDSRRPVRVISRSKLETNVLGSSLLDRIIRNDAQEGSPLRFLSLVLWQASVGEFIEKYDSKKGTKDASTLESAKDLVKKRPRPVQAPPPLGDQSSEVVDWGVCPTKQEQTLMELISAGERNEEDALRLLTTTKELFRGIGRNVDAIHHHLVSVKDLLQNRFRAPFGTNAPGLALSKALEQQLDQLSKVLAWLADCHLDAEDRIPWDVLVSLNERKPSGLEIMGDCAGIALRVAEVFEAANAWQAEISKVTMLSFRGGKRRGEESEGSAQATVDVKQVRRLVRDPVLRKVAMPRESAVSEILESAKTFEMHLYNFLGKDFDGDLADNWQDRAPYPDSRSLLGRSGEFLLYRLTGSPLYRSLMSSIEHISSIAEDVFADTPGKAAFEWIRQAVSWIDSIRAAVTKQSYTAEAGIERLVITESDARSILENGKSFFLDIPDDLKKTLSTHRIFMSTNKVEEKLKVVFKKGGAHHSVGGTAIKWCPILFDSLREDIARLDSWKSQVYKLRAAFQAFSNEMNGNFTKSEKDVVSHTGFHEELVMLLEEGIESLVVAPSKNVLDMMNELHKELQSQLQDILKEHSSIILNERLAKRRFEDHALLLQDRSDLLDALLARSSLEFETSDQSDQTQIIVAKPSDDSFRGSCRTSIEDALQSAARMIGIQLQTEPSLVESTIYSMKAGEIEYELYNTRSRVGSNATMMSFDYKDKSRTLGWILGDCINPKLALQVLLGEVDAVALVSMPNKELIGKWKALPEASRTVTQKAELSEVDKELALVRAESSDNDYEGDSKMIATEASIGSQKVASAPCKRLEQDLVFGESSTNLRVTKEFSHTTVQRPEAPPSLAGNANATTGGNAAPMTTRRPHAPPSLAASLVAGASSKRIHTSKAGSGGKTSRRGKYLLNSSGHDSFLLAVSKPWIKFKARFYMESDAQGGLNGVLPESLSERGRLRIEEFTKFLSGKLKGGKWTAFLLRLSVSSDEDKKKHKQFYKEYESMKRIAMFSISENSKLFLVTPKFHRAGAKAVGSSFSVETSTYAIALTRASPDY